MSLSASENFDRHPAPLIIEYLDVVLVILGAPIALLTGVSALGYGVGGGAWLALRAIGVLCDRAASTAPQRTQLSLRMAYMLGRLFLLALAVILAQQGGGQDAGLTALLVIVAAFTVQLATSAVSRPRSR